METNKQPSPYFIRRVEPASEKTIDLHDFLVVQDQVHPLRDYWLILKRHRWLILACTLTVFVTATLYTYTRTPLYTAEATLLIERRAPQILKLQDARADEMEYNDYNNEFYKTQYEIPKSRALAERVVRDQGLEKHPLFGGGVKSDTSGREGLISGVWQDLKNTAFPHLRYITNAAAALSNVKVRELQKAFPHAKLYSMYGQTECQRVSYLPPDQLDAKPASVGIAIPGTCVWIVDAEGNHVPRGSIGELVVSGPHVMRGYWNQPDQTARVLRYDDATGTGELHTGDLFRMDSDGFLYFVDRLDDMIKTRGEKVAPRQIEEVIARLPAVAEVSVYGVPDELLGEAVAASVALVPGTRLSRARIQRHCLEHLESFMVPRQIDIREALPTGANGKVDRRALREATNEASA